MEIHRPRFKNEWNVTTVVALFGVVVMFTGWVWQASQVNTEFKTWIANHEQLHKERQVSVTADQARTDTRLVNLEAEARKLENLAYRMTVQEQGAATLGKSVEELKTAVNNQAADLRVVLEILRRMDPANRGIDGQ